MNPSSSSVLVPFILFYAFCDFFHPLSTPFLLLTSPPSPVLHMHACSAVVSAELQGMTVLIAFVLLDFLSSDRLESLKIVRMVAAEPCMWRSWTNAAEPCSEHMSLPVTFCSMGMTEHRTTCIYTHLHDLIRFVVSFLVQAHPSDMFSLFSRKSRCEVAEYWSLRADILRHLVITHSRITRLMLYLYFLKAALSESACVCKQQLY